VNEDLLINIQADARGLRSSLRGASSDLNGMGKAMRGLKTAVSVAKMYALGTAISSAIKSSLDMIETVNLFNVAMGEMAESTDLVIQKMSEMYGLDSTNLRNTVGTYGLLARSMGMAGDQAQTLSVNTTKLAIDLSSLTNVPIDQVMKDLRSGLVGQSETVYKYGIDVTEAGIKAEAMAQGINKSVRNMSQGEKMALRYATMIRMSGLAQGDFAKTIMTPANQLRILGERFQTLSRSIGSMFIPMLEKVLPYLNALVSILIELADRVAIFFGYEPPEVKNGVTNSMGGLGDNAVDTGKKVDGTTKALKEMKKATMGFDELNILPSATPDTPDSGSGGGSGGSGGGGSILGGMKMPSYDNLMDNIKPVIDELKNKMIPYLKTAWEIAKWLGLAFLAWEIAGFIVALKRGSELALGLKRTMQLINSQGLFGALKLMSPQLILAGAILLILGGIYLAFGTIKDILAETTFSFKNFAKIVGEAILIVVGVLLLPVSTMVAVVVGIGLALGIMGLYIYKYWDEIKAYTVKVWGKFKKYFSDTFKDISKAVSDGIQDVKNFFTDGWESIVSFATDTIPNLVGDVGDWFGDMGDNIKDTMSDAGDNIGDWAKDTGKWFGDVYKDIKSSMGKSLDSVVNWAKETKDKMAIAIPEIIKNIKNWFGELPDKIAYGLGFALGTIVKWAIDVYDYITEKVPEIIAKIKSFFAELPDKIFNAINTVEHNLYKWISNMVEWMNSFLPRLMNRIREWFATVGGRILEAINSVKHDLYKWVTNIITWLGGFIPRLYTNISSWFSHAVDYVYTALNGVYHKLYKWISNIISWLGGFIPRLYDNISSWFGRVKDYVYNALNGVKSKIKTWVDNVKYWFNRYLPSAINGAVAWFKGLPNKIYQAMRDVWYTIYKIGTYLLDGIINGLAGWYYKIKGWSNSFIRGFKRALGIRSPSTVMRDEVGHYLGMGIMVGLDETTNDIIGSADGIANGIQGAFTGIKLSPDYSDLTANDMMTQSTIGVAEIQGNYTATQTMTASDNTDFTDAVYESVYTAISSAMKSDDNKQDVVMKIGSTELGRATISSINKITKQEGKLALNI